MASYRQVRKLMKKYISSLDMVIRGIALVSLIPFALVSLVMSVLTTDAPGSSIFPMFAVMAAALIIGILVFISSYMPSALSDPLSKLGLVSLIIARIPAYIFAPLGLYYGAPILLNIIF